MTLAGSGLGAEFWSAPAVAAALERCDVPVLLEEVRRGRGWSQAELARQVGYSQSWVSRVMRGKQALTVEQAREVSRRAGIPVHLLRLGTGGEVAAKRRDFGRALAAAGLAVTATAGTDTAPALSAITQAQRRLESTSRARELTGAVSAHVDMSGRMLSQARRDRPGIAAAVSEAAGLAAWLSSDLRDLGSARMYYRMAVEAARQAGHDLLAGYMLGSLAAFEIEAGDSRTGLALAGRAAGEIRPCGHPSPRAWLNAIEALGHAAAGDGYGADAALGRAADAAGSGQAHDPPPWPWLFPFDMAKLAGYRALACVRLGRASDALDAFAESLRPGQPAPKQRAMIMLEAATAQCQEAARGKDPARSDEAFALAWQAAATGLEYGSERVLHRARQFRRGYAGPVTGSVRQFDQQLSAALP
jgi:transcriptional regulator with XRE-family HTH domain